MTNFLFNFSAASEVSRLKIKLEKLTIVLDEKDNVIKDLQKQVTVSPALLHVSKLMLLYVIKFIH